MLLEDRRPVKLRHRLQANIYPHPPMAAALLKVLHGWVRLANVPGNGSGVHPLMKPKNNWFMNMPPNVELELPEATPDSGVTVSCAGSAKNPEGVTVNSAAGASAVTVTPGAGVPVGAGGSVGAGVPVGAGAPADAGVPAVAGASAAAGAPATRAVPVGVRLDAENVVMPIDVIHRLIDESRYIHIMNECVCRTGGRCTHHRHDIGCMFLGASGLDVAPPLSHPATREEAYAHVDAAIADGLVPQTMRIRADNYAFMFPDHHTVVAICFCCDCCYTQYYRDALRAIVDRVYHRPDGVRVRFDAGKCRRCTERACAKHCYMHALSVTPEGTIAVSGDCRTCGRCARVCPNGSARLVATDPAGYAKALTKLESLADLQGPGTGKKPLPY